MTTTIDVRPAGRLRDAWAAAHHPVPGVPRWARNAAYALPYTVFPSSLWGIAVCTFHLPIGPAECRHLPPWLPLPWARPR